MLKFYHNLISGNSRRVWIVLLEKDLPFEEVLLKLDGDQLQPEFMTLNPFHRVPVLVDDGFTIVESLAILDYLEAKYPTPNLLPKDPQALGIVRMVEMVTINELSPPMNPLVQQTMGFVEHKPEKLEQSKKQIATALKFFEDILGNNPYFGSEELTLADIVAGTSILWLPKLGVPLENYTNLNNWCKRLNQRPSWQKTQPSPEAIKAFGAQMKELMAKKYN